VSSLEADLIIYSLKEKKEVDRIPSNGVGIRTFSLSPDEKTIALVDMKGSVTLYSLSHLDDPFSGYSINCNSLLTHHGSLVSMDVVSEVKRIGCHLHWFDNDHLMIPSTKGSITMLQKDPIKRSIWIEIFLSPSDNEYSHQVDFDLTMIFPLIPSASSTTSSPSSASRNYFLSVDQSNTVVLWKRKSALEFNEIQQWKLSSSGSSELQFSENQFIYDIGISLSENYALLISGNQYLHFPQFFQEEILLDLLPMTEAIEKKKEKSVSLTNSPVVASVVSSAVKKSSEKKNNTPKALSKVMKENKAEEEVLAETLLDDFNEEMLMEEEEEEPVKTMEETEETRARQEVTDSSSILKESLSSVPVPVSVPMMISNEDDLDDDAFLSIDIDSFTQTQVPSPSLPVTAPTSVASAKVVVSKSPVKSSAIGLSKLSKVSKKHTAADDQDDNLFEDDDHVKPSKVTSIALPLPAHSTNDFKPKSSLSSLLNNDAAPAPVKSTPVMEEKAMKEKSPLSKLQKTSTTTTTNKEMVKSLFDDEAEEIDDDFNDEDDDKEGGNGKKKANKKGVSKHDLLDDDDILDDESDTDEMLIEEDDDDVAAGDAGEEGGVGGDGGKSSSYAISEILKLKKQLKNRSFLSSSSVPYHPVVHSSSTPFDDKRRRYLVWNDIGNITIREESLENRIEIRFTDMKYGKNEIIPDHSGFILASLGYDGAAFVTAALTDDDEEEERIKSKLKEEDRANEAYDEKKKGSLLYYHAFPGNHHIEGINNSFRIQLTGKEVIETVAVGKGFIAVTTNKQFLRVYNSIGLEISVTYLKGKVVSLSAFDSQLVVIYHASNSLLSYNGIHSLNMDLYEINWKASYKMYCLVSGLMLPLSQSKQCLEWIGFDVDMQVPVILDSFGNLSACMNTVVDSKGIGSSGNGCYHWIPILHIPSIRKSIDHKYWPIMIKSGKLVFVLLNGEKKPAVYPQPVVSTKGLKIPLSSTSHLNLLVANNKDNNKDIAKENATVVTKEKLHSFFYENLKLIHFENQLNSKVNRSSSSYYMISGQPDDLEKVNIYENELSSGSSFSLLSSTNDLLSSHDKMILTLFQEAIASQQLSFALCLIYQIRSTVSLQTAIVIANHFGKRQLAERVDRLLQEKMTYLEQQHAASQQQGGYPTREEDSEVTFLSTNRGSVDDSMMRSSSAASAAASVKPPLSSKTIVRDEDNHHNNTNNNNENESNKPSTNLLSRKASNMKSFTAPCTAVVPSKKSIVVSPNISATSVDSDNNNNRKNKDDDELNYPFPNETETNDQQIETKKSTKPLNPFCVKSTGSTPLKRKSIADEFTQSPTPNKKPALSVSLLLFLTLFLFNLLFCFFREQAHLHKMLEKKNLQIIKACFKSIV
jgi:hypothetical protein